jgi:hypothetical protein
MYEQTAGARRVSVDAGTPTLRPCTPIPVPVLAVLAPKTPVAPTELAAA